MNTQDHMQALPPGFCLGSYRVVRVLGAGGFGVTYLCEHSGLGVTVAAKEYLPNDIAVRSGNAVAPKSAADQDGYQWGLSRFLDEARTLARFEHRNVVRVRDVFEANGTAYIVMDYEDGEPLDRVLERRRTLTEVQLKRLLLPIVAGLRQVHAEGFLHRDVKPANIFIRRSDESPVLLDFGSARQALGLRSRSVTAIASSGYSPPEQYESDGEQGPWTDIYALSALCYRAVTGMAPVEATRRQSRLLRGEDDPLPRLAESASERCSQAFLRAVDRGLHVVEAERQGSLDEWWAELEGRAIGEATAHLVPPSPRGGREVVDQEPEPLAEDQANRTPPPKRRSRTAWLLGGVAVAVAVFLYFAVFEVSRAPVARPEPAAGASMDPEQEEWRIVRNSGDSLTVRNFLDRHPSGRFFGAARALLEQLEGAPFTVQTQPVEAQVRLLDHSDSYRAGMRLPAGNYRVEASAEGYATATEIVSHGSSSTVWRIALHKAGPKAGDRFRDCPECPEMVVVPRGTYRMGSPSHEQGRREDEGPVHEVTIATPFAIGVYEVTVGEFGQFVDETGHSVASLCLTGNRTDRGWRNLRFGQGGRHPMACVDWDDVQAYTAWLSQETGEEYRLPSESEWEYAARAGTSAAWPWGRDESDQCRYANGADASAKERYSDLTVASCRDWHADAAPVGSFGANGWGLHDMQGNVWELTEDCWNDSYAGAPSDGSAWEYGDCRRHVLRGGSWFGSPPYLRAAERFWVATGNRDVTYGFRVARTLAP